MQGPAQLQRARQLAPLAAQLPAARARAAALARVWAAAVGADLAARRAARLRQRPHPGAELKHLLSDAFVMEVVSGSAGAGGRTLHKPLNPKPPIPENQKTPEMFGSDTWTPLAVGRAEAPAQRGVCDESQYAPRPDPVPLGVRFPGLGFQHPTLEQQGAVAAHGAPPAAPAPGRRAEAPAERRLCDGGRHAALQVRVTEPSCYIRAITAC